MFDVHFHWFPEDLLERARQRFPDVFFLRLPLERIDDSIRMMDDYGIETSLIVYGAYLGMVIEAASDVREEAYRMLLERTAERCARHPGRFLHVAVIDAGAGEGAVSQLERAVKEYGCAALEMDTCYERDGETIFPQERHFWPLYAKAQELDVPVFFHPRVPPFWRKLPSNIQFTAVDWGFLMSNQLAIQMMAYGGVFDAFPTLQFIFCQLGGFVPFSLGRSDLNFAMHEEFPTRHTNSPDLKVVKLRDYAGRFYVDIHSMDTAAIRCAAETLGAEHILFATDFPVTPLKMGAPWHLEELRQSGLREEAIEAIKIGNARTLFKLPK
ncbi:MAG: amidohydrolase [Chloroflexi bacterium]|nr:amidohydrolase [Chloroflexota bacterium]